MSHPVVERRRREQGELLGRVASWARDLAARVEGVRAVVVFGSVARGDFNKWSDIDVLVVASPLPDRLTARADLLGPVPLRVQPIAWTSAELLLARAKGNPIAAEADERGIVVYGSM